MWIQEYLQIGSGILTSDPKGVPERRSREHRGKDIIWEIIQEISKNWKMEIPTTKGPIKHLAQWIKKYLRTGQNDVEDKSFAHPLLRPYQTWDGNMEQTAV